MKPYVQIAIDYAKAAADPSSRDTYCKWTRLAAKRFLNDLERAEKPRTEFRFDEWHACDPCDFIEKLPHIEGEWNTDTITLEPWQIFILVNVFGFRKKKQVLDDSTQFISRLPGKMPNPLFPVVSQYIVSHVRGRRGRRSRLQQRLEIKPG